MTESIITRLKISKSFKKLVIQDSFEKVTVSSIMKDADMRRQSFYDYFYDKYNLVDWIFEYEALRYISDNLSYRHWEDIIRMLIAYFDDHRYFYQEIFKYSSQNSFKDTYQIQVTILIKNILETQSKTPLAVNDSLLEEENFLADLLSHGIVEMTIEWINEDLPMKKEVFA